MIYFSPLSIDRKPLRVDSVCYFSQPTLISRYSVRLNKAVSVRLPTFQRKNDWGMSASSETAISIALSRSRNRLFIMEAEYVF